MLSNRIPGRDDFRMRVFLTSFGNTVRLLLGRHLQLLSHWFGTLDQLCFFFPKRPVAVLLRMKVVAEPAQPAVTPAMPAANPESAKL